MDQLQYTKNNIMGQTNYSKHNNCIEPIRVQIHNSFYRTKIDYLDIELIHIVNKRFDLYNI